MGRDAVLPGDTRSVETPPGKVTRARRLGAWGFEGESFPPPEPMLGRLCGSLGEGVGVPRFDAGAFTVGPTAELPDLGVEISTDPLDRLRHARGQGLPDLLRLRSGLPLTLPDGIARPTDDAQVETLLARAERAGLRVIPWGGGTSVTGGVNVLAGERPVVVLDLERLSGLEELDESSGLATLGAGTRGPALEAALEARGFTLGHFPQSFELSTLGGWIATHSSGQESLGYGRIADLVAGAEVVAPAGRLRIPPLPASATGPDLRQWVCGSEGRFGVLTRATVRVREAPATMRVEAALCRSWEQG
ncbi:MAG: FAD-binding oxidoreductase, partial [Holophagales bacterium]|nr:FAD-binding oxidoreductase [Holophagales bacterium]